MPAPHGHEKRENPFALRMNDDENGFVRQKAREWGVSLNLAICLMIQNEQQRERFAELTRAKEQREKEAAAPPAPASAPTEAKPRKPRKRAQSSHGDVLGPPVDPVPGQIPIATDDQ